MPQMTPEDTSSEVFLGPTGTETEEFYAYQREHPGLEKTEYLKWFEERFHKEIELRRRRSDQPSDLEFMVIKKRSKYRERIGEESAELVAHSEKHPEKTYRQLADWFQQKFQKEIDITAISRAIKRNRQEAENGLMPHPDQAPPPAKRGRRSLDTVGSSASSHSIQHPNGQEHAIPQQHHQHQSQQQSAPALGPPASSTGTFAVDRSYSNTHTPNLTPNHTPKNRSARMATPEESRGPLHRSPNNHPPPLSHQQQPPHASTAPHHPQNPQPLYPPIRAQLSPEPPRQPGWVTVNAGAAGNANFDPRRPSNAQVPPGPHGPSHMLRKHSLTGPPHQLPPALQPGTSMQRRGTLPEVPHVPPYDVIANTFRTRIRTTRQLQHQINSELHNLEQDYYAFTDDRTRRETQWHDERQALMVERDQLRLEIDRIRLWAQDLERGNLELQEFPTKYQLLRKEHERNEIRLNEVNKANSTLREKVKDQERQLAAAKLALHKNGMDGYGSPIQVGRKSREDLDNWVCTMFNADARQAEKTKMFLNDIENSGFKDFPTQLERFKTYLAGLRGERESRQRDWARIIGRIGSLEPVDTRMQDDGEDADDEGEVSKQSSKDPSPGASASGPSSPSTTSTSPLPTTDNEDKKVKIADMIDAI